MMGAHTLKMVVITQSKPSDDFTLLLIHTKSVLLECQARFVNDLPPNPMQIIEKLAVILYLPFALLVFTSRMTDGFWERACLTKCRQAGLTTLGNPVPNKQPIGLAGIIHNGGLCG